jgi:hypothetical protein
MAILGQPDPFQPIDTQDKITRISINTYYSPLEIVDRVEFRCFACHKTYWREVLHKQQYDEVVTVEGVEVNDVPAQYALNPTIHDYYAQNIHQCGDPTSI